MIFTCPHCQKQFQSDSAGIVTCPSCNGQVRVEIPVEEGCAWDREERANWVGAFIETAKRSFMQPELFFREVAGRSDWKRPLIYALIVAFIVFLAAAAYQVGFQSLAMSVEMGNAVRKSMSPIFAFSFPLALILILAFSLVFVPIFATLALLAQAGIYHLCLMLLGAARRPFVSTFRVSCYATGPQLLQIIPILGALAAWVWQVVLIIIGIKVTHETTYGRAILAVFLPTMICCGAIFLFGMMIAGGIFAAAVTGAH